jgi:uncharacterized protein YjgD (DUF1641 family)
MTDKLTNSYSTLFDKLKEEDNNGDNEKAHMIQDKLYRKFIRDIVNNKLNTINDIKLFADNMNKFVVKKDTGRWYS